MNQHELAVQMVFVRESMGTTDPAYINAFIKSTPTGMLPVIFASCSTGGLNFHWNVARPVS